jgi:hypothetical protein
MDMYIRGPRISCWFALEKVNKLIFQTNLKIISQFGTPCRAVYLLLWPATARTLEAGLHVTMLAAAAGRSYRETIRDVAGNTFTPKTILKLNLLLILYLKVWNKIVHRSWKSKKLETHNHNLLLFKAFIINKTFSMFGTCKFCILEDLTKNIILTAGLSVQPPSLMAWCFCGVIIWPWPPWGVSSLTWGKWGQLAPIL